MSSTSDREKELIKLLDQILEDLKASKKPVDISREAVARTIESAARETLTPGTEIHCKVMEGVGELRKK